MNSLYRNIGIFGVSGTGKTHLSLQMAQRLKFHNHKLIVLNHTSNEKSYRSIDNQLTLSEFSEYSDRSTHRLPANWTGQVVAKQTEFDAFLSICTNQVRKSVIILDDCGGKFDGKMSDIQVEFLYSPKNNEYNVLYQMHTLNQPRARQARRYPESRPTRRRAQSRYPCLAARSRRRAG